MNRLDGKRLTETKQIYGFESEDIAKYEIARFSDFLKCGGILKEFDWHYNLNELSIKKKDLKKMIENPNLRDLFAAAAFNQSKNKNAQTPNGFSKEEKIIISEARKKIGDLHVERVTTFDCTNRM